LLDVEKPFPNMNESLPYCSTYLHSPIGVLQIVGDELAVSAVQFMEKPPEKTASLQPSEVVLSAAQQLQEYFDRTRQVFDFPLNMAGSPFQQKVWDSLLTIEYGKTASYKDIALRIQNLKAIRAVGSANGSNPIAIVVPCHRIIGSDGSLTGYAGQLWRKKWLLEFEQVHQQLSLF